jgi:hypothetical protein
MRNQFLKKKNKNPPPCPFNRGYWKNEEGKVLKRKEPQEEKKN